MNAWHEWAINFVIRGHGEFVFVCMADGCLIYQANLSPALGFSLDVSFLLQPHLETKSNT